MLDVALEIDAARVASGQSRIAAFESNGERFTGCIRGLVKELRDENNFFRGLKVNAVDLMNRIPVERGTIRTLTRRGRKARIDCTCWALKRAADNVIDPLRVGNNG